ncbi:DUF5317 family protein [Nocardioides sp. NPDC057772]|uniref:DUF5317 family protein n=1 Tax=Nocardioides sp. NPDC057772 TaxID=3346245 RepID=UPI00366A8925
MLTLMMLPAVIGLIVVARPNVATSLTKLQGVWLIAIAAVLQFVQNNGWWPEEFPEATERRLYAVLVVCVAVGFCWLNRSFSSSRAGLWALWLIPLGTMSNAIPIAALGAMPYSLSGARLAGYSDAELVTDAPGYIRLGDVSQLWTPLADLLPIPILMKVLSIGDLFLFAGLVLLVIACSRPTAERGSEAVTAPGGASQTSV